MSKREISNEDVIDSYVVDVHLLMSLKHKPLRQSKVTEIKTMFNKGKEERKKVKYIKKNPHVTAMLSLNNEASCTAFKRLQALEEDDDMFDDDDKVDIAR
eukprot:9430451-Ditylum_brightwellii.AAC.1